MTAQPELFGEQNSPIFADLKPRIVREFFSWHEENPHVFDLYKQFAWQLRNAGRQHYGTNAIIARIRWHMAVETRGDIFKINDHHAPCYARLLILRDPSFKPFFETRHTPGTIPLVSGGVPDEL